MPRGPTWYQAKFKGYGYRWTLPRQKILEVLNKSNKHLSAEDIYHKVHEVYPMVGLTTVYRTLDLLVNADLVFKFDFGDGRTRYELTKGRRDISHHHHLICTNCQRVIDYTEFAKREKRLLSNIKEELSRKHKFEIHTHQVHFYGLCDRCRKETVK